MFRTLMVGGETSVSPGTCMDIMGNCSLVHTVPILDALILLSMQVEEGEYRHDNCICDSHGKSQVELQSTMTAEYKWLTHAQSCTTKVCHR